VPVCLFEWNHNLINLSLRLRVHHQFLSGMLGVGAGVFKSHQHWKLTDRWVMLLVNNICQKCSMGMIGAWQVVLITNWYSFCVFSITNYIFTITQNNQCSDSVLPLQNDAASCLKCFIFTPKKHQIIYGEFIAGNISETQCKRWRQVDSLDMK